MSSLMPCDENAERKVLALVINGHIPFSALNGIQSDAFFKKAHKSVFEALTMLSSANKPINDANVLSVLQSTESEISPVDLDRFLSDNGGRGDAIRFKAYLDIVKRMVICRKVYAAASDLCSSAKNGNAKTALPSVLNILEESYREIMQVDSDEDNTKSFAEMAQSSEQHSLDVQEGRISPAIPTGFFNLDYVLTGLHKGTLNIIAARPGEGKTVLAMNIVRNLLQCEILHKPILFFSLELSLLAMSYRMISSITAIPYTKLEKTTEWEQDNRYIKFKTEQAVDHETGSNLLYVNDKESDLAGIIAEINRQAKAHHGVSLIVIDYLQLMHVSGTKDSRNTEIGIITRTLREKAKELDCPVIVVSQLNRQIERQDRKPNNSDLRDSGAIESDADTIIFITRPADENDHSATLYVNKNRFGQTKEIPMIFNGEGMSFREEHQPVYFGGGYGR